MYLRGPSDKERATARQLCEQGPQSHAQKQQEEEEDQPHDGTPNAKVCNAFSPRLCLAAGGEGMHIIRELVAGLLATERAPDSGLMKVLSWTKREGVIDR